MAVDATRTRNSRARAISHFGISIVERTRCKHSADFGNLLWYEGYNMKLQYEGQYIDIIWVPTCRRSDSPQQLLGSK